MKLSTSARMVTKQMVAESTVSGPDAQRHIAEIRLYIDAGHDHVYVRQIGADQEGTIDFYARDVLPHVR